MPDPRFASLAAAAPAVIVRATMKRDTVDLTSHARERGTDPKLRVGAMAGALIGSEILKIAGDIRALVAGGREICNLTVGDFDPKQFPIPERLKTGIVEALEKGETNYPPSDGLPVLRKAVAEFYARELGRADEAGFRGRARVLALRRTAQPDRATHRRIARAQDPRAPRALHRAPTARAGTGSARDRARLVARHLRSRLETVPSGARVGESCVLACRESAEYPS